MWSVGRFTIASGPSPSVDARTKNLDAAIVALATQVNSVSRLQ